MKTEDIAKARVVVKKLEALRGHISPAILNSMLDEIEALSARAEKAEAQLASECERAMRAEAERDALRESSAKLLDRLAFAEMAKYQPGRACTEEDYAKFNSMLGVDL